MKPASPSVLRVALQDTTASILGIGALGILVAVPLMFANARRSERDDPTFLAILAGMAVTALLLGLAAWWRARRKSAELAAFWERAESVEGEVLSVRDVRAGRSSVRVVRYAYEYGGERFEGGAYVPRGWQPRPRVPILVDPEAPGRSEFVEKYARSGS